MELQLTTGYASVNGTGVYWESRGNGGTPLIMVHGGYGRTTMFGEVPEVLGRERQVIAIELRGHGHTADTPKPFTFEEFGDDIAGVISWLGFERVDLLGCSLGGGAALRCAIQHPALIRKLVIVAAPHRRSAWFPEVRAGFDGMDAASQFEWMRQSPLYSEYVAVAPDPDAFPSLIDKTGELLRRPYDWSAEVKQLPMPVLLAYGDADSIPPSAAAEFFALFGGGLRDALWDASLAPASWLAILPGTTHYTIAASPLLATLVGDFLK